MSTPWLFASKRGATLALLATALLLPWAGAQEEQATAPPPPPRPDFTSLATGEVVRVEAADVLVVDIAGTATTVRLIGTHVPQGVAAAEAQAFVSRLLSGETVYLREEPTWPRDPADGRLWAYVFRAPDGLLVNLELARLGFARVAGGGPFEYRAIFEAYEGVARKLHKGIWAPSAASESPAATTQPAPAVDGAAPVAAAPADENTTVYVTEHGRKYHRQGCVYVRSGAVAISLKEAKARGLTPCKRCEPPR